MGLLKQVRYSTPARKALSEARPILLHGVYTCGLKTGWNMHKLSTVHTHLPVLESAHIRAKLLQQHTVNRPQYTCTYVTYIPIISTYNTLALT